MKAFEVKSDFESVFVETEEDALLVADEFLRQAEVIGASGSITVEPVEILSIPANELRYVQDLRDEAARLARGTGE